MFVALGCLLTIAIATTMGGRSMGQVRVSMAKLGFIYNFDQYFVRSKSKISYFV